MKATTKRWTRRIVLGLAAGALVGTAAARDNEIRIARQYGIAYIPLMIMQDQKLVEKHAAQLGLPAVTVTWQQFAGGAVMNDALLSGNLDFAVAGPPPFVTIWARTQGTGNQVVGIASLNAMPMYLMTRNPAVKSIKDFTEKDKIVVSGVKVSTQAVALQMAAAKEWGIKEYDRLDKLTVAMPLSDSMALMLSGKGEVTGDFTVPPFSFREAKAGMKAVLDTYTVMGGPSSTNVIYATKKFVDTNPKMVQAFSSALREAQASISKDKAAAAAVYLKLSGDKESVENVVEMLSDPRVEFSPVPRGIKAYADFLHSTGAIKSRLVTWKDAFVPELHPQPGN